MPREWKLDRHYVVSNCLLGRSKFVSTLMKLGAGLWFEISYPMIVRYVGVHLTRKRGEKFNLII